PRGPTSTRTGPATRPADAGPRPARRHPTCRRTGRPPAPRGAADVTRANPLSALRRLYTVYSWQRPPGGADGPRHRRGGSKGEPPMELTLGQWAYRVGMVAIIGTLACRRNVVGPAVAAPFAVTWACTGNGGDGLESMFKASLVAAGELFNIFLIIALITAMLGALQRLGSDKRMVQPFRKVMTGGSLAFWVLAAVTFVISLFFWPTPAVPLVGAILLPAAIRAGLPPLQAGVAIAIAGQGMALAADYVIQVAPDISATSAGIETADVADRGLVLSVITGVVALVIAWYKARGSMLTPSPWLLQAWEQGHSLEKGSGEGVDPDRDGTFDDQAA